MNENERKSVERDGLFIMILFLVILLGFTAIVHAGFWSDVWDYFNGQYIGGGTRNVGGTSG